MHARRGFTLVEMMIVITIISILSTIAVVSYTRVQKQARDAKRKSEVKAIQTALQAYYVEKQHYPILATTTPEAASTALASFLVPAYISNMPNAPAGIPTTQANSNYMYVSDADNGYAYALCVELETPESASLPIWKVDTNNAAGYTAADAACAIP